MFDVINIVQTQLVCSDARAVGNGVCSSPRASHQTARPTQVSCIHPYQEVKTKVIGRKQSIKPESTTTVYVHFMQVSLNPDA